MIFSLKTTSCQISEGNCLSGHARLPAHVRHFIFNSSLSYAGITKEIKRKFGRVLSKSTISYHKRNSLFRSPHYNASGKDHDISKLTDWEKGYIVSLFAGDGSTFKSASFCRVITFYFNNLKERPLAQNLTRLLKKAGLRPYLTANKNLLNLRVNSQALYKTLSISLGSAARRPIQ